MVGSSTVSTLLVLTLIIVNDVLSAPREARILEVSRLEDFLETREEEVAQTHSLNLQNKTAEVPREDEMLHRFKRLENVSPASNETENKVVPKKKSTSLEKSNDISRASGESSEAKDMRESKVNPKDDDELPETPKVSGVIPIADEKVSACVQTVGNDSSTITVNCKNAAPLPADVLPDDDSVLNIADASEEIVKKFSHYDTINPQINLTPNKSDGANVSVHLVPIPNPPINGSITTTLPTIVATPQGTPVSSTTSAALNETSSTTISTSIATIEPKINSTTTETAVTTENTKTYEVITEKGMTSDTTEVTKSAEMTGLHALRDDKATTMPSGVVALITAIAFAVVAVVAYISLVAWRRYLEWRYGNRELLVNDFDANDMSNFEL